MDPGFTQIDGDHVLVRFDLSVYTADAIAKAAHRMTDRCFAHLEREGDEAIICRLRAKNPSDDMARVAGEFANEALDQLLRDRLGAETEAIRNVLLAHAFSDVNLLHPELDGGLGSEDPLRIGASDAERS